MLSFGSLVNREFGFAANPMVPEITRKNACHYPESRKQKRGASHLDSAFDIRESKRFTAGISPCRCFK